MVSELIEAHQQLRSTIYKMAHGCTFTIIQNVFSVSKSLITSTFGEFVKLPTSHEEWISECKEFVKFMIT